MVVAGLGAAVLVAGGGATAVAVASSAAGDDLPVVVSSGGPTLAPSTTPSAPVVDPPGSGSSAEPPLGRIPRITSRNRVAMPLDPVMTSMSDITLIGTAGRLKARDCMRSLGFRNWTATTITDRADDNDSDLLDYLDPATVARSGYPSTLTIRSAGTSTAKTDSHSKPTKDAVRAFIGAEPNTAAGTAVPRGGCQTEGDRQVKADVLNLPVDPRFLALQAKFAALHDSRMRHTFATWSACMSRNGLHYHDPIGAQNDPRWGRRTSDIPAGAAEQHTATIDAVCQKSVNVVGMYKALEAANQKRMLTQNSAQLAASDAIFSKWVKNAKAIIAGG